MKIIEKLAARNRNAGACAPVLIAFIGDSVTHGCFEVTLDETNQLIGGVYDPENGYPNRLKRRLDAMYPAASVSILKRESAVNALCTAQSGSNGTSCPEGRIWWSSPLR